ncbi:hypothetical protein A2U01_0047742, partial [Trifolium medium]|nr:hypothetical protein [Trifolium medium]
MRVFDPMRCFSIKSLYLALNNFVPTCNLGEDTRRILKESWNSMALSKVKIFSWQPFLHCLPARGNIPTRGVLTFDPNSDRNWCMGVLEVEDHLFCD